MIMLALHLKYTSSKRNKPGIVLTYYNTLERGSWHRPLRHRGIWPWFIAERSCDQQEIENYERSFRMRFIQYDDWDLLIEDELRFPDNPVWIAKLHELKSKHSMFKRDVPYHLLIDSEPQKPALSKVEKQDLKNGQLRLVFSNYHSFGKR